MKKGRTTTNLPELPGGCLSHILSFTSPRDVFRSSLVSKDFLAAAESDMVWERFFPSDYEEIISQSQTAPSAPHPPVFASKKDLFVHLCRSPVILGSGTKSFGLDKWSGKKCYMLAAIELAICWGDTPRYWKWTSFPESRFSEVAELLQVWWLDIRGRLQTKLLSPNTTYGAYFVFKLNTHSYGLGVESEPIKVWVKEGDGLDPEVNTVKKIYLKAPELRPSSASRQFHGEGELPYERADGWMEIEIGQYFNHGDGDANGNRMIEMSLRQIEVRDCKSGLIVQGIELRPSD
ncbi:hypothetical protein Ancab_032397 [Ancistrocladus abbreviatus]